MKRNNTYGKRRPITGKDEYCRKHNMPVVLILCIVLANLFAMNQRALATNIDSIINKHINITKPYLVINVVSNDCILCRAGAAGMLEELKDKKYINSIVLLSDDKNMGMYYDQNNEIFGQYLKIFDKKLSNTLTIDTFYSSICLVTDTSVKCFKLTNISSDDILKIKNELSKKVLSSVPLINSDGNSVNGQAFSPDERFFYLHSDSISLFNSSYQISREYYKNIPFATFVQKPINDSLYEQLYASVRLAFKDDLCTVEFSKKILKKLATPQFLLKGINDKPSLLFRLNTVFYKTKSDSADALGMRGRLFIATMPRKHTDIFDVNNYRNFLLFDTVHCGSLVLKAEQAYNIENSNGFLYVPFYLIDSSRSRAKINKLYIVRFSEDKIHEGAHVMYEISDFDVRFTEDFFFRVNSSGVPIAVNNKNKTVSYLTDDRKIKFNELTGTHSDSTRLIDLKDVGDRLEFVGRTGNVYFKGVYKYADKKVKLSKLSKRYLSIKIVDTDRIIAYNNDLMKNVVFDTMSFDD